MNCNILDWGHLKKKNNDILCYSPTVRPKRPSLDHSLGQAMEARYVGRSAEARSRQVVVNVSFWSISFDSFFF